MNFAGTLANPVQYTFWSPQIHVCPIYKMYSPDPNILKSFKSFIPSSTLNLKSHLNIIKSKRSTFHHLSHLWLKFRVWYILEPNSSFYLWTYETRKQVICFQNTMVGQAWARYSQSKREKEGERGHGSQTSMIPSANIQVTVQVYWSSPAIFIFV